MSKFFNLIIISLIASGRVLLGAENAAGPIPPSAEAAASIHRFSWLNSLHEGLYERSSSVVEQVDGYFISEEDTEVPFPPPRFRLGLFSEVEREAKGEVSWSPVTEFSSDVDLPNLERHLKLILTTEDPVQLPGGDAFDSDSHLRIGAMGSWKEFFDASIGVRTKWPVEAYAYTQWSPAWNLSPSWSVYPRIKPFWESDERFGGIGSCTVDWWRERWTLRQALSMKWSQANRKDDSDRAKNPDNPDYLQHGGGWRWELSTMMGYILQPLNEQHYGRHIRGADFGDGYGVRLSVRGNIEEAKEYRVAAFRKGPIHKDVLYYLISPEVIWEDDEAWEERFVLKLGVEVLFWDAD